MSGTTKGGKKTLKHFIDREGYTEDGKVKYFVELGKIGGTKSRTGGVYGNPERASEIGKLGGRPMGYKMTDEQKAKLKSGQERYLHRQKLIREMDGYV